MSKRHQNRKPLLLLLLLADVLAGALGAQRRQTGALELRLGQRQNRKWRLFLLPLLLLQRQRLPRSMTGARRLFFLHLRPHPLPGQVLSSADARQTVHFLSRPEVALTRIRMSPDARQHHPLPALRLQLLLASLLVFNKGRFRQKVKDVLSRTPLLWRPF